MTEADWLAWCEATAEDDEPPGLDEAAEGEEEPGLAAGELVTGSAGFTPGGVLDTLPGSGTLALFADQAAGEDDRFADVSDAELDGVIAAWDRVEAHASARKHAAVAEFIRRRPEPECELKGPARMPAMWDEFAVDELRHILAENLAAAEQLMSRAHDLAARLPGTMAAFRAGTPLDPAESRAAEKLVLGRAGRLTPGGLRAAIARAVMEVAPDKARKRREAAARDARVQRWAEDSGNAALTGRELPPDEVLAADQRITAWARELRAAGLEGGMDELRARAYLDLLLGKDSRPRRQDGGSSPEGERKSGGADGGQAGGGTGVPGGPGAGAVPAGFAARLTLTVPAVTLTGLADRPGELAGTGPVDPWLARDLAASAALNPKTTWCVTVTDEQGHAVGHGCARPEPKSHGKHRKHGNRDGPGFSFAPASRDGPPGGFGTWRLSVPGGGPDLIVALDSLSTQDCSHRFEARGHDPGVKLRHLAEVRHATCTSPVCRRPAGQCDFEHNVPYETGGRTCLCNGGPKCRHDHRLKQHLRWQVDQNPDGTFTWTTPSGRTCTTEPTRYPI